VNHALAPLLSGSDLDTLAEVGWVAGEGFADASVLLAAHDELETLRHVGDLKRAGVSRGDEHRVDSDQRRDSIAWVDPSDETPALNLLHARFASVQNELNRGLFASLRRFELQSAWYPPGGFYRRHVDSFAGSSNRLMTAIVYLNRDWAAEDGGELRVWNGDTTRDLAPAFNHWVVFFSERVPHEVRVTRKPRWALTSWYRIDDPDVPLINDPIVAGDGVI
jgi:SM-20-related protein